MSVNISVSGVSMCTGQRASIMSRIRFKRPDGTDGEVDIRFDEFRSPLGVIKKLSNMGALCR
jgi:hypothetical protein